MGWNSVLFDASQLPVEENQRQTIEVVAEARRYGAHVEGEIEGITRRRGRPRLRRGGGPAVARRLASIHPRDRRRRASRRPSATPTACMPARAGPSTTTASRDIVAASRRPDRTARRHWPARTSSSSDLIARGCAKVNISTALKIAYMQANREFLGARSRTRTIRRRSSATCHARCRGDGNSITSSMFGSQGQAWRAGARR